MPQRIAVGELEIEYDEAGTGGRPFVLVHGFTGSRDDFTDVLEPLAALGHTLVPDQRGHGGTTNPGSGYSLDQLSADLAGFLDAKGIERCDLLGHSLGGMVALRFALAAPERLASLVLMDTAARSVGASRPWLIGPMGQLLRRIPPSWLWRFLRSNRRRLPAPMRRAEQAMGSERYWERLRVKLAAVDPAAYDQLLPAVIRQQSVVDRLGEIRCATLVIVGDQDETFLAPCRELADHIPDAKLVVVEDSHHSPQIEASDAWLSAIRTHLEGART
jgi:pimeloyl-ACP methyl ester carboxylesterase